MNIKFPKFQTFTFDASSQYAEKVAEEEVQSFLDHGKTIELRHKYVQVKIGGKFLYVQYHDEDHRKRICSIFPSANELKVLPGFQLKLYHGFYYAVPKTYKEGYWTLNEIQLFIKTWHLEKAVNNFKQASVELHKALSNRTMLDITDNLRVKHNLFHILEKTLPDKLETVNQVCAMEYKS